MGWFGRKSEKAKQQQQIVEQTIQAHYNNNNINTRPVPTQPTATNYATSGPISVTGQTNESLIATISVGEGGSLLAPSGSLIGSGPSGSFISGPSGSYGGRSGSLASSVPPPAVQQQLQQQQQLQEQQQQQAQLYAQHQQQASLSGRESRHSLGNVNLTNSYNSQYRQEVFHDDSNMNTHDDHEDSAPMPVERERGERPTSNSKASKSNKVGSSHHHQKEVYDVEQDDSQTENQPSMNPHQHMPPTRHDPPEGRQNHLNSLFNGHLMKWKFEAEEGSAFIRIPAFFGALALMTTAIVALVLYPEAWTSHSIVMSVGVIIMSIFILILDGRFLSTNPLSARAHLRNVMTRNFNIFRYLWGRALLYIVAGTLNVAQWFLITICSGAFLIVVGVVALFVGIHASRKFSALRNSLADESYLLLVFSNYDHDGDGYLAPNEFALLLADLGMELDDRYTLKAFNVIDCDNDRKISFEEFNHWWASGYIERGRKRWTEHDDYRRMD